MVGGQRRDRAQDRGPLIIVERTADMRSEEHTSELQSQSNLVCRLLLEKKQRLDRGDRLGSFGARPVQPAGPLAGIQPGYLMAPALAGDPLPPGACSGELNRNIYYSAVY